MYWADEMVQKKRENEQATNHRLTRYIMLASLFHIAPLIDIPMFNFNNLATHKVQVHAGAMSLMCMYQRQSSLLGS